MTLSAKEKEVLEARLREFVGQEAGPLQTGPDLVNEPMIRHWCEAMGDTNPVYLDPAAAKESIHGGLVAPPTMMQAWVLRGIEMATPYEGTDNRQLNLHGLLTEAGYPSVVATNCEQEYTRYLRPGDEVRARTVIESISDEKATGLGVGYFIDTRTVFRNQDDEEVGWMTFRVLKFRPHQQAAAAEESGGAPAKPRRLRAPMGHDNAWWWDGVNRDELLIQECASCGTLRHPPRPMCGECQSLEWKERVAGGGGTVYSWVVLHHPPIPGYEFPLPVALVELDEGTRIVANVEGCEPSEVYIGMRVEGRIENVDEELKLPVFRPAA